MSPLIVAVMALIASVSAETNAGFQPSASPSNLVQQHAYPATYPAAYPEPQPQGSYSYSEPQPQGGYSVQTGYEGYLVPAEHDEGLFSSWGGLFPGRSTLLHFIPKAGIVAGKVGLFLIGSAALLVVGTAFMVGVCTFTPICKLTLFGFPFSKESMRSYITPDRLTQATIFVRQAIDKYRDLQNELNRNDKREMADKKSL